MSERQPKFHPWFHNFLIYFALWAFPLFGIAYGIRYISFAHENAVRFEALVILLSAMLILLSLFAVKVRFDLAAFRARAPKELLGVCLAAAAVIFLIHLLLYVYGATESLGRGADALIFALWGIVLYRYYHERPYLFKE